MANITKNILLTTIVVLSVIVFALMLGVLIHKAAFLSALSKLFSHLISMLQSLSKEAAGITLTLAIILTGVASSFSKPDDTSKKLDEILASTSRIETKQTQYYFNVPDKTSGKIYRSAPHKEENAHDSEPPIALGT